MLVISAVPGPSDFLVVARAVTSGFAHALVVTAGIIGADFALIAIAMFSLNSIAAVLGPWFFVVELLSGTLLLVLGASSWRARSLARDGQPESSASAIGSFAAGFSITLGDPKALLFYIGFLPAFVDLTQLRLSGAATVMLAAMLAITVVKVSYAALATKAVALLESPRARGRFAAVGASVLVLTGIVLLIRAAT